jgi:putative sterol carrier protein
MTEDPRQMLAEAVKDRSDEDIIEFANQMGGVEQLLDLTFEGMKSALDPDAAQDCIIGYELTNGADKFQYAVVIKDKTCEIEKREPSDARVTLGMSAPDYLRLITGNLDGMQAFMQGKLKAQGDIMFAQQIQRMFRAE